MDKAIKEFESDSKAKSGFVIAFILLLASILISLYTNQNLKKQAADVNRTNDVILGMEYLLSKLKDAETGIRGYIVTGNKDFLEPFNDSKEKIDSAYKELKNQTKDNLRQQENLTKTRLLITDRYTLLLITKEQFEKSNKILTDSTRAILPRSKIVMDRLRVSVKEMQNEEKRLLEIRSAGFKKIVQNLGVFSLIAFIIAIILFGIGIWTFLKENKARIAAVKRIKNYQAELNQRVEQLAKANEELIRMRAQEKFAATGRIARTIAHEVRNPLTNINLASDQLKAEYLNENEEAVFLFEMIDRNSSRINQLISDLLQSTKFAELSFTPSSINAIIEETLGEADDRIALTNTTIVKKLDLSLPNIPVDKQKIKIALTNIIVNALEAMEGRNQSQVSIETAKEGKRIKIKITDTGCGMDAEAVSKLFEPYFTSKPKGNGLGLTNTQNIILSHKGEIFVNSTPGTGTTFTIYLNE